MSASLLASDFDCACGHVPSAHRWPQSYCHTCLSCGGDVNNRRGCCRTPKRCPCNKLDQSGPSDPPDDSQERVPDDSNTIPPAERVTNGGELVSDMHSAALRAGVFQVVEREAKAQKDAAKAELVDLLPFGDTVAGRVGDDLLCKASWSKGSAKVVITDERAFLEWVKEHHPTEIVEKVNDAYVKALKQVDGSLVDADGNVAAGIEVQTGAPSLSVRSEKGALELVARMVTEGRVSLDGIKELAAADTASYSLAEVRDGTGWPKDVRFTAHSDSTVVDGEVVEGSAV